MADEYYAHAQRVYKDFETKNLGEYHDLYFQSHTLLSAYVFKNVRNMCLRTNELNLPNFIQLQKLK